MTKEEKLVHKWKMDAVNVQGVWPNFPTVIANQARALYVAGLYLRMMEEYRRSKRKRGDIKPTPNQLRNTLLKEIEKRIQQEDEDDLALILML